MTERAPKIAVLYSSADVNEHAALVAALEPLAVTLGAGVVPFVDGAAPDASYFDLVVALVSSALLGRAASAELGAVPYALRLAVLVTRCPIEASTFSGWPLVPGPPLREGAADGALYVRAAEAVWSALAPPPTALSLEGRTPMPFRQHLSHDDITKIYASAVDARLTDARDVLLGGLAPAYVSSLLTNSSPTAQLLSDVNLLNTTEAIEGGVVPLERWLASARDLTRSRRESGLFEQMRAKLAAAPSTSAMPSPSMVPVAAGAAAPPARPPARPVPAAAFAASVVFLSIADLKEMAGPDVPAALSALHGALRAAIEPLALPDVRVLSSLTGAIVLWPDSLNRNVHKVVPTWARAAAVAGVAVRAGVSRGLVELIEDADHAVNAIGRSINVAARIAASPANPGVLYDEKYADYVKDVVRSDHFLSARAPGGRPPVTVKGKREEVFTCFADPGVTARAACAITGDDDAPFANAILLAYDLPDFSEGHLRVLVSRFRSISQEVRRLREEHGLSAEAGVSFSPGGDGGVLVFTRVPPGRALGLATELGSLLLAAGTVQSEEAPVRARIAVHYGLVTHYENAERVTRPTGLALFDADGLAGDDEARRYDTLVISGTLIESAARGTPEAERFEKIGAFVTAQGTEIQRYVARGTPGREPQA